MLAAATAPCRECEAAGIIRDASESRSRLRLLGGGTQRSREVDSATPGLSSRGLVGITRYNPEDQAISVRAGTPVADVSAALAEKRQHLAFEPTDFRALLESTGEPTIGGVAAANVSGPRRPFAGAARDHLMGVRFINGSGEIVQTGATVIKNVTGLDLTKLIAGSRGSLGFITEVTFRVSSIARAELTFAIRGLSETEAPEFFAKAVRIAGKASAAAFLPKTLAAAIDDESSSSDSLTLLRLEGSMLAIDSDAKRLAEALRLEASAQLIRGAQSRQLWRGIRDAEPLGKYPARAIWRLSVAPMSGGIVADALTRACGAECMLDWRGGLIWARLPEGLDGARLMSALPEANAATARLVRGQLGAERRPLYAPVLASLTSRLQRAFDPFGIFESAVSPNPMAV
jgi:glycolate oxidase FAD binding subunit